ncbi:MAG: ATP-dependent helicase, partial [Gammaproteobacteria bacterium]
MLAQDNSQAYFSSLNPEQADAVATTEGALLVLAGAGTGKTRVLTTRITHILQLRKAFPSQILAVTFTNKAAREMRDRIEKQLEGTSDGLWLGTFHAIAAKILRRHAECVGLTRDFQIIDMEDQGRLIKQLLRDFNIDDKKHSPKLFSYLIGRFKDKAYSIKTIPSHENTGFADGQLLTLYHEYQRRLKQLNACDFGDLLLYNIELFNNHPEVYEEYLHKFKYILVDEYQDTNVAQYIWLRLLAKGNGNICCVGDDDQSIYGWRGAEVTNILKFDRDFPGAKIIRLEQNYRSTNHILSAATKLISNNDERHGKSLWTAVEGGNKIKLSSFYDDREEARYIAEEIEYLQINQKHPLSDVAILVRAGYQTRCFEESFNFLRIPYRIIGGL